MLYKNRGIESWCARRDLNPQPISYEPTALTIELQAHFKLEVGMGIEPMLVPHLGNTDYKSVGAIQLH